MAILNGLSTQYENIVTTLDALGEDSEIFTLKVVKSPLLREGQRQSLQKSDSSETALIGPSMKQPRVRQFRPFLSCSYCKRRGHREDQRWHKHPSLIPPRTNSRYRSDQKKAFLFDNAPLGNSEKEDVVCLFVDENKCSQIERSRGKEFLLYVDSGASSHMTLAKNAFKTL